MAPVRTIPIGRRALTGQHARSGARYESGLERDFFELMTQDPLFKDVDWQPLHIHYFSRTGRRLVYTPDALVTFNADPVSGLTRRPLLVEVKYREEYRSRFAELKDRLRAARRHAKMVGWDFEVVTEREIRSVVFANRRFLHGFVDRQPSAEIAAQIQDHLRHMAPVSIQTLLDAIWPDSWGRAMALPTLWWMIGHGRIDTDLHVQLSMHSTIRFSDGKDV